MEKLCEVANFVTEKINSSDVALEDYVTTDNLLQNKEGVTLAVSLPVNNTKLTKYQKGDILISNIRPYLRKIWFANKSGGCSNDVLVFRAKENTYSDFLHYVLFQDDFFDFMMSGSKGTKMPRGDKSQMMNYLVPNFDLTTQQKIAQTLSTLDRKIALNQQINAELEKMAKTLYDYWFVQFDFPDENGKPYKSSGGEMVWNDVLKRYVPKGWEVKNLFEICNVQYGFPFSTAFFNEEKQGYPVIRIRDILDNQISNYSTELNIDEKYKIEIGDVLIGMDGNFHINYWSRKDCFLNQRVVKINSKLLPSIFIKLQIEPIIKMREKSVSRTTVGHLSDKDLKAINLLIPSGEILNKICKSFNAYLNKMMANNEQTQTLTQYRDFLLPMLMNGQVGV